MKKKKFNLGLNKVNISKLGSINGGMGTANGGNNSNANTCVATISRNFIDVCCQVFGTDECNGTKNGQCGDGDQTGACLTHEETCVCAPGF